ncbi:MAG: cobalt transporter CbiM [bacterium]|jgi:cobalt/nickel transport system permease protein
MHLMDGVVSFPVAIGGFAVSGALAVWSAYQLKDEEIPRISVFTAAFFVASLIHFRIGVTSVHLVFNGLLGVVLGRRAFLAVPIGLFLQFALLSEGGAAVLGVNTLIFGIPALICGAIYEKSLHYRESISLIAAGICGALGVLLSGLLLSLFLVISDEKFNVLAFWALMAHVPIMILEGIVTAFTVAFLRRVQPSLLQGESI